MKILDVTEFYSERGGGFEAIWRSSLKFCAGSGTSTSSSRPGGWIAGPTATKRWLM